MKSILTSLLLCCALNSHALPFSIVPTNPLPPEIVVGGTVLYTVTNLTNKTLSNDYVAYLPPNVSQVTIDPSISDLCGATFTLQPKGQSGDSCQLELQINAPVHVANCSDPTLNIFICASDQTTCAGPAPGNSLDVNTYAQILYVADDDVEDAITICPVNANGFLGTCYQQSDITFADPIDIILNHTKPIPTMAYIANVTSDEMYTISQCPVLPSGSLGPCTEFADPSFILHYTGLTLNAEGTMLYLTDSTLPIVSVNEISICPVGPDGYLLPCTTSDAPDTHGNATASQPNGRLAFSLDGTHAYIPNFNTGLGSSYVSLCEVALDGSLDNCAKLYDSAFTNLQGIDINPAGSYLYLANNYYDSTVAICPIKPDYTLGTCIKSNGYGTFSFDTNSTNIFTQNTLPYAYIPNGCTGVTPNPPGSEYCTNPGNTVSICPFLPTQPNGNFAACTPVTGNGEFSTPDSVWIANFYSE